MPAKTNDPIREVSEEISSLEEQRENALSRAEEAEAGIPSATERLKEISVAVVGEDPAAVEESEDLEEMVVRQSRRAKTARAAASQLEGKLAETKVRLAEEERRQHRERFAELAAERGELEEDLEATMADLLRKLSELRALDGEQRAAAYRAGEATRVNPRRLGDVLEGWLLGRLGGYGRYLPTAPPHEMYREQSLAQLDPLARET